MKYIGTITGIIICIFTATMIFGKTSLSNDSPSTGTQVDDRAYQSAYFAGGCFWCLEGIFESQDGVQQARVGYMGGSQQDAEYREVASGNTKHREVVKVIYDPLLISYEKLVELFWTQIDPTDTGGQFADRGFQYTTAIYYANEDERSKAEVSKQALQDSDKFDLPIVTELVAVSDFFEAEEYHQDYYKKSSFRYKLYSKGSGRADFIEQNWRQRITELHDQTYSDQALRERLTPLQYKVTQQDGTEPPFQNAYWDNKQAGIYVDIIDGTPLYSSLDKFDSGTGWPSFSRAIDEDVVTRHEDTKLFMTRIEARSASSDAHLGHIFPDGPSDQGGMRHCINSASLRFISVEDLEDAGYGEYRELFAR